MLEKDIGTVIHRKKKRAIVTNVLWTVCFSPMLRALYCSDFYIILGISSKMNVLSNTLTYITGPDSANGRASASGAGGRGFDPGPRHTKSLKMVPVATLPCLALSIIRQELAHLSLTTNTTNIAQKLTKKKLTPSTWFPGTRLMSHSGVKTYRKIDIIQQYPIFIICRNV